LSLILQDVFEIQEYNFGAESLAVVGGFAADAVSVILTRISEILISVVKGSESDSSDKEIINKRLN